MPPLNFDKSKIFKTVTTVVSVLIGIVAILIFSGKFPGIENSAKQNTNRPNLIVWGTLPRASVDAATLAMTQTTGKPFQFTYEEISEDQIEERLLSAKAVNQSPDLILAPSEILTSVSSLSYIIPYTYMTENNYKTMYIDATHIYATPFGAQFYPVLADPLITIYNKKLLRENGLSNAPALWQDLPQYQSKITKLDNSGSLDVSAIAIGANNVLQNKNILVTSLMQMGHNPAIPYWFTDISGSPVQKFNTDLGLQASSNSIEGDIYALLKYQTSFVDSQKITYTWNEAGRNDLESFLDGKLAIMFGLSSYVNQIKALNPNLEIDISYIPQMNTKNKITSGRIYGVAVSNTTKDFAYAVEVAQTFAGDKYSAILSRATGMSSARKDVLAGNDGSTFSEIVGVSALTMGQFYNLNNTLIANYVYSLYDNILSGRQSIVGAVDILDKMWIKLYNN